MRHRPAVGSLLVCLLLVACGSEAEDLAAAPQAARRVYFVPLGSFPKEEIQRLVIHYRQRFKLQIETLVPVFINTTTSAGGPENVPAQEVAH